MVDLTTSKFPPALSGVHIVVDPHGRHGKVKDHEFKLNGSFFQWRAWHGFRRGLATDLQKQPVKVAQGALRHADPIVTLRFYQKTVDEDVRTATEERSAKLGISLTDTYGTPEEKPASEARSVN